MSPLVVPWPPDLGMFEDRVVGPLQEGVGLLANQGIDRRIDERVEVLRGYFREVVRNEPARGLPMNGEPENPRRVQ